MFTYVYILSISKYSLGCLVMCKIAFNIIVAIFAFTIGFAYFILSLIPTLPPPNGFLIHWQNHQDFWAEGLDLAIPPTPVFNFPHPSAWHPSSAHLARHIAMTPNMVYFQPPKDSNMLHVY